MLPSGRTQASIVNPAVGLREGESGAEAIELVPLSEAAAAPSLPGSNHDPEVSVIVLPFPELSAAVVPAPSLNPYAANGAIAGALLVTVTLTGLEVVVFPAASRATAVSVCVPS